MQITFNYISLSSIFSITSSQWKLFLHLPIKLIPKKTQKNYTLNSYVLFFLISVIWFFLFTIQDGESTIYYNKRNPVYLGSILMLHSLIWMINWANQMVVSTIMTREGWSVLSIIVCQSTPKDTFDLPRWNFKMTMWEHVLPIWSV